MERQVLVSLFNNKTKLEFLNSPRAHLGSVHKIHTFRKGDVVLLLDIETKCLFGMTLLDSYESGKVYQDHHPLDIDMYSGDKSHYNRYEVKIQKVVEVSISFENLALLCGKTVDDKSYTNIWRGTHMNFRYAQYRGPDSDDVMKRLNALIDILLSVK